MTIANAHKRLDYSPLFPSRRRAHSAGGGGVVPTFRGAALVLQTSQAHHEVCIAGPSETGKTYAALWYIDTLLRTYPKAQAYDGKGRYTGRG